MGRWEALVKIVEAFVASGRPGYGLLALTIMTVASLLVAVMLIAAGAGISPKWFEGALPTAIASLSSQ